MRILLTGTVASLLFNVNALACGKEATDRATMLASRTNRSEICTRSAATAFLNACKKHRYEENRDRLISLVSPDRRNRFPCDVFEFLFIGDLFLANPTDHRLLDEMIATAPSSDASWSEGISGFVGRALVVNTKLVLERVKRMPQGHRQRVFSLVADEGSR
jgi:hypothetical protein